MSCPSADLEHLENAFNKCKFIDFGMMFGDPVVAGYETFIDIADSLKNVQTL